MIRTAKRTSELTTNWRNSRSRPTPSVRAPCCRHHKRCTSPNPKISRGVDPLGIAPPADSQQMQYLSASGSCFPVPPAHPVPGPKLPPRVSTSCEHSRDWSSVSDRTSRQHQPQLQPVVKEVDGNVGLDELLPSMKGGVRLIGDLCCRSVDEGLTPLAYGTATFRLSGTTPI